MALNVRALSASKLKNLKSGETIDICYSISQKELDNGGSRVIAGNFPKNVAIVFSSEWATEFPTIKRMSLKELTQPKEMLVNIVGGDLDVIRTILSWIMSCCEGKGMQQFPSYRMRPFTSYYIVKENAINMGIRVLSDEMERRLSVLTTRQVHSEDVRAMYLRMPADHPVLKDLANHIADLIWQRKLRAFGAYRTLREEIPVLDQHLNAILDGKQAARREEAIAQRQNERRLAWEKEKQDEEKNKTTLHCNVVRKANKGRPAYASLPLADMGINKHDFLGDTYTSMRATTANPKMQGQKHVNKTTMNRDREPDHTTSVNSVDETCAEASADLQVAPEVARVDATSPTKAGNSSQEEGVGKSSDASPATSVCNSTVSTVGSIETTAAAGSFMAVKETNDLSMSSGSVSVATKEAC